MNFEKQIFNLKMVKSQEDLDIIWALSSLFSLGGKKKVKFYSILFVKAKELLFN